MTTLYSIVDRTGTGGPLTVPVPPYLDRSHIQVYVDSTPWSTFEWVSDSSIRITAPVGSSIRVQRRSSPSTILTDYQDGTSLPGSVLEVDSLQAFYLAQEALDAIQTGQLQPAPPGSGGLTPEGVRDLLNGMLTPSQLELTLRAEVEKISGPESVFGTVAWRLLQESIARTAAIEAEAAARATALLAEAAARQAAITVESTARQTAIDSLASQVTTLTAGVEGATAAVQTEAAARAGSDDALASQITVVAASVTGVQSSVTSEASARATADAALATQITSLSTSYQAADAALQANITTEASTRATAVSSLASRVSTLEASYVAGGGYDDSVVVARLDAVEEAVADETAARVTAISSLTTAYQNADTAIAASITAVDSARSAGDAALATRASVLEAKVNLTGAETVKGLIAVETAARTAADSANASAITTVQSSITGLTSSLATVQTSANTSATKLGNVEANYTLKVQARSDGKFVNAGIGILATTNGTVGQSEMIFMADQFRFVPSGSVNDIPQPLFVSGLVSGVNTFVIPASRMGDGLVAARMVVDGAIEARHLRVKGGSPSINWDPECRDRTAWFTNDPPNVVQVSDASIPGGSAMRMTGSTTLQPTQAFTTAPGRQYRITVVARKTSGSGPAYIRILFYNAANTLLQFQTVRVKPTAGGAFEALTLGSSFVEYVGKATAPAAAVLMQPQFIAQFEGTGVTDVAEFRLEEMQDYSLIVDGGLKADNIDTRGLTIKDEAGNVIFGSGVNLAATRVTPASNWLNGNITLAADGTLSGAGGGAVTYSGLGGRAMGLIDQITAGNVSTYIANAAIGNAQIGGDLWSTNYTPGSAGWIVRRNGDVEFNNGFFRGDIRATSVTADTITAQNLMVGAASMTDGGEGSASGTAGTITLLTRTMNTGGAPLYVHAFAEGVANSVGTGTATIRVRVAGTSVGSTSGTYTAPPSNPGLEGNISVTLHRPVFVPSTPTGNFNVTVELEGPAGRSKNGYATAFIAAFPKSR